MTDPQTFTWHPGVGGVPKATLRCPLTGHTIYVSDPELLATGVYWHPCVAAPGQAIVIPVREGRS